MVSQILLFGLWASGGALAGTRCLVPDQGPAAGYTTLALLSAAELARREAQQAVVERRAVRATSRAGALALELERARPEAADLVHHTLIAMAGDEVILRQSGSPTPATPIVGGQRRWQGLLVVPLPEGTTFPLRVHAFDQSSAHSCGWTIDAGGVITLL
ncbi:MAG TPA: hypothetical protein ENK18_16125 [Deltaproteobacteria bacterium]|nr:hypothetical protein [Deltaproteobacteria bacterium]